MKSLLAIPVCILACCALAFSIPKAEAKTEKLALNVPNMAFPFFAFMRDEANNEAKKSKVDLIVQDGQGSSPKQSSDLRNAVTQGVDGIVLDPNDVRALTAAVNDVLESGIPVVSF